MALAACLLHDPQLLLLDEPTAGVDPKARRDFWEQIHALSDSGLTVLVSTHYMDEAERCDRIVYILNGKLVATGTVHDVIERSKLSTFVLEGKDVRQLQGEIQDKPGVGLCRFLRRRAACQRPRPRGAVQAVAPYHGRKGIDVHEEAPSLEDVFIQLQEKAG